jgi:DNA mismatch repair protein MutS
MGMVEEYFEFYKKYSAEYGEKTAVLYCCGSFYEIYEIDNEKENIGNAKILSNILNMKYANKSGNTDNNSRSYPNFIGFTTSYLPKYLPVLLENNYTVVIVDQLEEASKKTGKTVRRGVTAIHSPGLQPPDLEAYNQENNLVNVMIEILPKIPKKLYQTILCSVICINNSTNEIEICEKDFIFTPNKFEICLDDINRIVKRYYPREINVKCINDNEFSSIKRYFEQNYSICKTEIIHTHDDIYKNYIKIDFQNKYLGIVYKHLNFGMLQPSEYLKLDKYPLSILNFIFTLDFIAKHDLKYITNLNIPKIIVESDNLVLELDTLRQLKIIDGNGTRNKPESVFDVIDFTLTHMGKRHLKSILTKPFKDHHVIEKRYKLTEEYSDVDYIKVENLLRDISDFERLHRKMGLEMLHPYEFVTLDKNYSKILEIIDLIKNVKSVKSNLVEIFPNENSLLCLNSYMTDYYSIFNLNIMKEHNLNSNKDTSHYFNKGQISEIDTIQQKIVDTEKEIEDIRQYLDGTLY